MGDLSAHFSRSEFRCKCDAAGHPLHDTVVSPHLIKHLEDLRAIKGGKPLRINSGYRCVMHNLHVGGAGGSRHVVGDAADIPAGYCSVDEAARAGFTGIGRRGQWAIHVDTRPLKARWSY